MTKEQITKNLKKGGHSDEAIKEIHKEAENSSNPEFIYHYQGGLK